MRGGALPVGRGLGGPGGSGCGGWGPGGRRREVSKGPLTSDPRPAVAGELYDLDASSLQLKVLQYVSPYAPPLLPSQPGFRGPALAPFPAA